MIGLNTPDLRASFPILKFMFLTASAVKASVTTFLYALWRSTRYFNLTLGRCTVVISSDSVERKELKEMSSSSKKECLQCISTRPLADSR